MKELVRLHRKVERIAVMVFGLMAIILVFFQPAWILSLLVGALTATLNFRLQVRGIKRFAKRTRKGGLLSTYFFRTAMIALVLFMAFERPDKFSPYVVFGAIICFQVVLILTRLFNPIPVEKKDTIKTTEE